MTYPYEYGVLYTHLIKYFYPEIDVDFYLQDDNLYIDFYVLNKEDLK